MDFTNTICTSCYRCPRHQPLCSGGRVACNNCQCLPSFHSISSSQFPVNINAMNNHNVSPNQQIISSSQNNYLSNFNPTTPFFPFVNNNVSSLIFHQTHPAFNQMPMHSSNSPGVNVNAPNIYQNTSSTPPFQQNASSLSNSITSPNPQINNNLINPLHSSMKTESNHDSNATPKKTAT